MKKKLLGILVTMLLISIILPVEGTYEKINNTYTYDQLDQFQFIRTGTGADTVGSAQYAQGFTPTLPILTRVWIYLDLYKSNSLKYQYYYVTIKADSPDASELTKQRIITKGLNDGDHWYEVDITDIGVTPGNIYYINVYAEQETMNEGQLSWCYGIHDPYPDGDGWIEYTGTWQKRQYSMQDVDYCFKTYGLPNNPPNQPSMPDGPSEVRKDSKVYYSTSCLDIDGHQVYYMIDWGDGSITDWDGPYPSAVPQSFTHTWTKVGTWNVKSKARDEYGAESEWSRSRTVKVPKTKVFDFNTVFLRFLDDHLILYQIFQLFQQHQGG